MAKITQQVTQTVTEIYNGTNLSTGSAGSILRLLDKRPGEELTEVLNDFKDVRTQSGREALFTVCQSLAKHFKEQKRYAVSKDFETLASRAKELISDGEASFEDLRVPSQEEFDEFLETLIGVARALAKLFYNGGFKAEDLARDKYKLSKTFEGIVEVQGGMGSTRARTVTSENSFGLTKDEFEELVPVLQGKLFTKDNLGLQVLNSIGNYTNGWKFSPTQLRVAHAERLLEQGLSNAEVADIQGVRPETLRFRQRKYRNARKG